MSMNDSRIANADLVMDIEGRVNRELQEIIQKQIKKDAYYLSSGKIRVPKALGGVQGYNDSRILVQNDADFYIHGVSGVYGYWCAKNRAGF